MKVSQAIKDPIRSTSVKLSMNLFRKNVAGQSKFIDFLEPKKITSFRASSSSGHPSPLIILTKNDTVTRIRQPR